MLIVGPSLSMNSALHVIGMMRDPGDILVSKQKKAPARYRAP